MKDQNTYKELLELIAGIIVVIAAFYTLIY